jgi:hypothetical protein
MGKRRVESGEWRVVDEGDGLMGDGLMGKRRVFDMIPGITTKDENGNEEQKPGFVSRRGLV